MRVGSLFSGIGGIELGLERAGGFETAWFVENDPHAQAILRKHWPNAQVYDDVTTLDFGRVPAVDVLTGGFPCQDISNAGKRAGITGHRSGLWKHYLRAISVLRPRYVIAENVAALTQRGLDTVLCDLAAIGYDAEWHCIPAAAVGAPHRRDRIFILAYPFIVGRGEMPEQQSQQSSQSAPAQDVPAWPSAVLADSDEGCRQDGGVCARRDEPSPRGDDLANAYDCGCVHGQVAELADQGGEPSLSLSLEGGPDEVGDTNSQRCEEQRQPWPIQQTQPGAQCAGWWASEPDVGRVANGVPARVDRIKRLGNAVVPQVAQAIGEAIKEAESE